MKTVIEQFLTSHLSDDLFIVEIKVSESNNQINVFIDGDAGITIDTIGKLSRELERFLDDQPTIPHQYMLNVSSAGLDRPLVNTRQFKKNVNRDLRVIVSEDEYQGRLVLVSDDHLIVQPGRKESVVFRMEDIEEAYVEI